MIDSTARHQYCVETVEENVGEFTWRIVNRDLDTGRAVGAPVNSVAIYASKNAAESAASETLRKLVAGNVAVDLPRSAG